LHAVKTGDVVAVAETAAVDGFAVRQRFAVFTTPVGRGLAAIERVTVLAVQFARDGNHGLTKRGATTFGRMHEVDANEPVIPLDQQLLAFQGLVNWFGRAARFARFPRFAVVPLGPNALRLV
jgi:hypothetical protein